MVVGGVSTLDGPGPMAAFSKLGVLSETGCKPFAANADGYGRSEGYGAIVLKRLDLAERDGDRIYAVVADAHTNQDGHIDVRSEPAQQHSTAAVAAFQAQLGHQELEQPLVRSTVGRTRDAEDTGRHWLQQGRGSVEELQRSLRGSLEDP